MKRQLLIIYCLCTAQLALVLFRIRALFLSQCVVIGTHVLIHYRITLGKEHLLRSGFIDPSLQAHQSKRNFNGESPGKQGFRDIRSANCFVCGNPSHKMKDCPYIVCRESGKSGHMASECGKRSCASSRESLRYHTNKSAPQPIRSRDPSPIPGRGCRLYHQHSKRKIQIDSKHVKFSDK